MDAWQGGAQDQLQGQIASAKIPLSRMISPQLYGVMTGDDFSLDINNPKEPKILCVGNNPDRQNIYSAALGLYNSRIVKIPASKIANLTQGMFVGAVSDNFDERIEQKIFHAQIIVDNEKVAAETKTYQKIPEVLSFTDANGNDTTKEQVEANYRQIKLDVVEIIEREKERISNDPELRHLVEKEGE